jgi:hypothetical protein
VYSIHPLQYVTMKKLSYKRGVLSWDDNLVIFYYNHWSEIPPDKRGGLGESDLMRGVALVRVTLW